MTPEDRLLCLCARQDFLPAHQEAAERLGPLRWDQIVATAERHAVLPIVGVNLRRCALALPEGLRERLDLALFENAALKERDADRLAAGIARLREVELDAMILKGMALSLSVYQEPWVVTSQDIDLSLRPWPGWWKGKGEERKVRWALYTHGIECDLEGHHDVTMNGVLPIDFGRIWREARPVRFRGVDAWVMSPEDQMIALAVNGCRKHYFRLKTLFDVAETLRWGPPLDWERLGTLAREGRCEGIVYTALVAARETLGAELPAGALDVLGLSARRTARLRRLIAAFLSSGSFVGPGPKARALSFLLTYASLRPAEAWKSALYSFTHRHPHKGEDPYSPVPSGTEAADGGAGTLSAGSPSRS